MNYGFIYTVFHTITYVSVLLVEVDTHEYGSNHIRRFSRLSKNRFNYTIKASVQHISASLL